MAIGNKPNRNSGLLILFCMHLQKKTLQGKIFFSFLYLFFLVEIEDLRRKVETLEGL